MSPALSYHPGKNYSRGLKSQPGDDDPHLGVFDLSSCQDAVSDCEPH